MILQSFNLNVYKSLSTALAQREAAIITLNNNRDGVATIRDIVKHLVPTYVLRWYSEWLWWAVCVDAQILIIHLEHGSIWGARLPVYYYRAGIFSRISVGRKDFVNTNIVAPTICFIYKTFTFKNVLKCFKHLKFEIITLSGGSLGSRIDEERSKAR